MRILRERVETETGGRAAGIVTALLLCICIISVAFFSYLKSVNPSASPKDLLKVLQSAGSEVVKEAQVQYSFDFDSGEKPVFVLYNDYIVKCGSGGIWFLNKKGEVVWSESMVFNQPMVKTNGSQLLAADIGAGDVYVIDGRDIRWRERLDAAILNADISEDGYVTIVTTSKRDNNEIRVYDPHGVELFRKIIANDFVISAYVAPSERTLVVSGVSTGVVGAHSIYKLYDLQGEELASQTFEASGELLPLFWYNDDDSLFAVGDRAAAYLDKAGKLIWEKQFKSVAGAGPMGGRYFAAAVESDEGIQLKLYSTEGRELSSCKLQNKPEGLTAVRGSIAVNTYDTVYFYDDKCKNTGKYFADSHIRQVCFFTRQQAAVITDNKISVINIS